MKSSNLKAHLALLFAFVCCQHVGANGACG